MRQVIIFIIFGEEILLMKKRIIFGAIIAILGLLITVGPHTIFHVCPTTEGEMAMACHYTAIAESGIGVLTVLLGLAAVLIPSAETRLGLSISTSLIAVLVFSVPTFLIGVCGGEHMHCHAVTLPALIIISVVLFIVSITNVICFIRKRRKANEKQTSDN